MTDPLDKAAEEPTFNLLDEPWLPVRWRTGGTGEVGLSELFARSREIEGLAEASPPAFVALHRLLLAVTHRALTLHQGRWTDSDRARWYRDGLPLEAFESYFGRWRERFWLFHPTQPFMQVAALATATQTRSLKPWTQVSLESAAGNNPVMFDHSLDASPSTVPAAAALRAMVGFYQFTPGGPIKVLRKDGFGRKGALFDSAAILPTDSRLDRTLVLSLHPASATADEADHDLPTWERPPLQLGDLSAELTLATGPNDRYTRLTRAVLLDRASGDPGLSRLRACEGKDLQEDEHATDPMNSYRQGTDKWIRLRFTDGRSLWRDLPALLPSPTGSGWRPAAVLVWAQNLLSAAGSWDNEVEVTIAGMAAIQGKMLQARMERFRIPVGLMTAADTSAALRAELKRAEELHSDLRSLAARMFALALPNSARKEVRKQARDTVDNGPLSATYFARAERGLPSLLRLLGVAATDPAHDHWSASLLDASRLAWSACCDLLGASASALRARALTEGAFLALVHPLRPERGFSTALAASTPEAHA